MVHLEAFQQTKDLSNQIFIQLLSYLYYDVVSSGFKIPDGFPWGQHCHAPLCQVTSTKPLVATAQFLSLVQPSQWLKLLIKFWGHEWKCHCHWALQIWMIKVNKNKRLPNVCKFMVSEIRNWFSLVGFKIANDAWVKMFHVGKKHFLIKIENWGRYPRHQYLWIYWGFTHLLFRFRGI